MANFWVLGVSICINVIINEGRPRIFLNDVYRNTNKQHNKYRMNPYNIIPAIRFIKVIEKKSPNYNDCFKNIDENREACLRRLKYPEVKYQAEFNNDYEEDVDRAFHGYNNFSHDYLDIKDLLRTNASNLFPLKKKNKIKKSYNFKVLKPNKYDRFTYDLSKTRRSRKRKYDSDDSASSESSESVSREAVSHEKVAKNKRFQIVDKSDSGWSKSSEEVEVKRVKKRPKTNGDGLMYMQSPSRLYDLRRRLPHFFPKRYHWDEEDIRNLRNYWFSGPQGRYWGQYKTPYS